MVRWVVGMFYGGFALAAFITFIVVFVKEMKKLYKGWKRQGKPKN